MRTPILPTCYLLTLDEVKEAAHRGMNQSGIALFGAIVGVGGKEDSRLLGRLKSKKVNPRELLPLMLPHSIVARGLEGKSLLSH